MGHRKTMAMLVITVMGKWWFFMPGRPLPFGPHFSTSSMTCPMKKITGEFRIADSQEDIFTSVDGPPQWNVCWWTSPHLNRKLFKRILHQLVIYYSYLHQLNAIYKPHNGAPVMICSQDCWLARVLLRFDRHFGGAAPLFAHLGAAGRGSEPSVPSVGFGRGWRSQWPGQFLSWWDFLNGFSSSFIGQKGVLSHQKCNEAVDITNCFAFFSVHFF